MEDLVSSLLGGKLRYALGDLAAMPRAAVVVEDRYSQVFKLERVRPATVADGLAELQVRWPQVPLIFCETRQLAEEWTYRFLAAAYTWATTEVDMACAPVPRPVARPGRPGDAGGAEHRRGQGVGPHAGLGRTGPGPAPARGVAGLAGHQPTS